MNRLKLAGAKATMVAGLVFSNTACLEAPTSKPAYGAIQSIKNSTQDQYKTEYSCQYEIGFDGKLGTICKDRDEFVGTIATKTVKVIACRQDGNKKVIADQHYIENHSQYPSDYPLTGEGQTKENIACSFEAKVTKNSGLELKIGQLITTKWLDGHRPISHLG